jgi:hypothetical protein
MNPLVFAGGFFIYFPITYLTVSLSDRANFCLSDNDISKKNKYAEAVDSRLCKTSMALYALILIQAGNW